MHLQDGRTWCSRVAESVVVQCTHTTSACMTTTGDFEATVLRGYHLTLWQGRRHQSAIIAKDISLFL
jgi:hypothetical protein